MGIEQIDLYLLHWRGSVLAETVARVRAARERRQDPLGVSFQCCGDLDQLFSAPAGIAYCSEPCCITSATRRPVVVAASDARAACVMAYFAAGAGRPCCATAGLAPSPPTSGRARRVALAWLLHNLRQSLFEVVERRTSAREPGGSGIDARCNGHGSPRAIFPPPSKSAPLAML